MVPPCDELLDIRRVNGSATERDIWSAQICYGVASPPPAFGAHSMCAVHAAAAIVAEGDQSVLLRRAGHAAASTPAGKTPKVGGHLKTWHQDLERGS